MTHTVMLLDGVGPNFQSRSPYGGVGPRIAISSAARPGHRSMWHMAIKRCGDF